MNTNETNNPSNPSNPNFPRPLSYPNFSLVPSFPSFPPVPNFPSFPPVPSFPGASSVPSSTSNPDPPDAASNPPEAVAPEASELVPPDGRVFLANWLKNGPNRCPDWVERGGPEAFEAWVDETAIALRRVFAPPEPGKPRYVSATMDYLRNDGHLDLYRVRLFVSIDHEVCNVSRLVGLACGLRVGCTETELRLRNNGALLATIEARLLVVLYGTNGPSDGANRGLQVLAV
jgi:hypothetical protein